MQLGKEKQAAEIEANMFTFGIPWEHSSRRTVSSNCSAWMYCCILPIRCRMGLRCQWHVFGVYSVTCGILLLVSWKYTVQSIRAVNIFEWLTQSLKPRTVNALQRLVGRSTKPFTFKLLQGKSFTEQMSFEQFMAKNGEARYAPGLFCTAGCIRNYVARSALASGNTSCISLLFPTVCFKICPFCTAAANLFSL